MTEKVRKIYSAIQQIPENELTQTVIKPTLEKLGFLKVEFYGGTDEEGKDLLCWKKDPLGEIVLIVAQVKHFKFTNKASGGKSFQNVVNQLTMSLQKRVQYSDKSSHIPEQVYLISSKEIDSKNIKGRFSDYPDINQNRIKIIDGYRLSELILKNCPEIASKLINEDIDLTYYSSENLTNDILLKALGFNKKLNLKSIYTDIDFSLGKHTTKLFFNLEFKGKIEKFNLDKKEWGNFQVDFGKLSRQEIDIILNENIEDVKAAYNEEYIQFKKWEDANQKLKIKLSKEEDVFKKAVKKNERNWNYYRKARNVHNNLLKKQIKEKSKNKALSEQIKREQSEIKELEKKLSDVLSIEKEIEKISQNIEKHSLKKIVPKYYFSINGNKIEALLEEDKKFIKTEISKFNSKAPSKNELKLYLQKCDIIFKRSFILLGNVHILQSLGIIKKVVFRKSLDSTRFKLPINKIFDTNLNLVLLGEAGAGKTTSLQMYAINNKENEERIILWAPLIRLVQKWSLNSKKIDLSTKIESLDLAICEYLQSKNINLINNEILDIFNRKKVVVLFDGLDESIKSNEWLPEAINYLAKKYANSLQIIVTSRMTGEYVEKLDFLTVTLLPFTQTQRNQFINNWFEDDNSDAKEKVILHFKKNKSIDETTRNPLLTTTLCVLAKHDLPLPNTEIKLYDNRLKLLAGYYDNVKNIPSRISTTPHNLEYLSKKIAYYLHSKFIRELEYSKLEEFAINCLSRTLSPEMSKKALKELIDPCNILVPMTDTGKYGFGHLRYQEHLAASELLTSRSVNIPYLMTQVWWKESLLFFSQMSDSLIWLAKDVGHFISDENFKKTFNELIELRPEKEKEEINLQVKEFVENFDLVYNENNNL
ncbi:NACHT domain-containing protein [Polaribacter sp. 11A2H]|uniref:NACHT domain-containing protein n=1 Tax=Polaribacter sp. 11A2H TaxID=2687290 RepID=UPI001409295B|nr:NACHT domain-containing protein [Polaribacter sp. 11A2H]